MEKDQITDVYVTVSLMPVRRGDYKQAIVRETQYWGPVSAKTQNPTAEKWVARKTPKDRMKILKCLFS